MTKMYEEGTEVYSENTMKVRMTILSHHKQYIFTVLYYSFSEKVIQNSYTPNDPEKGVATFLTF